jgi:hypothetical protein
VAEDTPKFTLRFHNARNHQLLGFVAEHMGLSKNQLAEEMLERELQAAALFIEADLLNTVALLEDYRRAEHLEEDIERIAEAEAYERDPIQARMAESGAGLRDAYGVMAAFRQ